MKSIYIVLTDITLGYGSTIHSLTPRTFKTFAAGDLLLHASDAPDGTVWFFDKSGDRGKIDSGEVQNLVRSGVLQASGTMFPGGGNEFAEWYRG